MAHFGQVDYLAMGYEPDDDMGIPAVVNCRGCGTFVSSKPSFAGEVSRGIPSSVEYDEEGNITGYGPDEEVKDFEVEYRCKKCGRDAGPDQRW